MATTENSKVLTDQEAQGLGLDTNFTWTRRTYGGDVSGFSLDAVPKAGTPQANRASLVAKAEAARARMQTIAAGTGTPSNAQVIAALRDVAKVVANLIPLLLDESADPGD